MFSLGYTIFTDRPKYSYNPDICTIQAFSYEGDFRMVSGNL